MNIRDKIYVCYFILHIPISLLIDSSIGLPYDWQFGFQRKLAEFHLKQNNDVLFAQRPAWLQGFVWVELLLQVPFFFWGAIQLSKGNPSIWPAILVYGVEAAITTFACLVEIVFLEMPFGEKINLFMVYLPTFVIPVLLAVDFWIRISSKLVKAKTD